MDDENKENVGLYMIEMIDFTKDKLPSDFNGMELITISQAYLYIVSSN